VTGVQLALGQSTLAAYLLALGRTAGFVLTATPFNSRSVPLQARVGLAVALALPLTRPMSAGAPELASAGLWWHLVAQVFVGLALGFAVQLALSTVQAVGDLLDTVGGFSAATALDPLLLVQTSVMGRLHQIAGAAVLFATDAHLMVLRGLSFGVHTASSATTTLGRAADLMTQGLAGFFAAAVQIAGPVIAAMLVADISLGLLTKAAPALNAFSLGYPLKILFTLLLAGLLVARLPEVVVQLVGQASTTMAGLGG
jgi:flagellar biosynthesis protein FliR